MSSKSLSGEETLNHHVRQFVDLGRKYNRLQSTSEELRELWTHWTWIDRYAYSNDKPDIFNMVVTFDQERQLKRVRGRLFDKDDCDKIEEVQKTQSTVLHSIIKLSMYYYRGFSSYYTLPKVVQLLIGAGASLHGRNERDESALEVFMHEVEYIICHDVNLALITSHMIIETVEVMLASCTGTEWSNRDDFESIIQVLLDRSRISCEECRKLTCSRYAKLTTDKLSLIAWIIYKVVVHISDNVTESNRSQMMPRQNWLFIIMDSAGVVTNEMRRCALGEEITNTNSMNEIMNTLGEIYRCIVLHCIEASDYFLSRYRDIKWLLQFMGIAEQSFLPGRSSAFIRHVLRDLNATQINELKRRVLDYLKSMSEGAPKDLGIAQYYLTREEFLPRLESALKCLCEEEAQRSLQQLARRAIIQSMSHRSLTGALTLGLPRTLVNYVLLNTN